MSFLEIVQFVWDVVGLTAKFSSYNSDQIKQIELFQKAYQKNCKNSEENYYDYHSDDHSPVTYPYYFQNTKEHKGTDSFIPRFFTDQKKLLLEPDDNHPKSEFAEIIIKNICNFQVRRQKKSVELKAWLRRISGTHVFDSDPINLFCEEFKNWTSILSSIKSNEALKAVISGRLEYIDQIKRSETFSQKKSFMKLLVDLTDRLKDEGAQYEMTLSSSLESVVENTKGIVNYLIEIIFYFNIKSEKELPKNFIVKDLMEGQKYDPYFDSKRGDVIWHFISAYKLPDLISLEVADVKTIKGILKNFQERKSFYPIELASKKKIDEGWWQSNKSKRVGVLEIFRSKEAIHQFEALLEHLINLVVVFNIYKIFQKDLPHSKYAIENMGEFLKASNFLFGDLLNALTSLKETIGEAEKSFLQKTSKSNRYVVNWQKGVGNARMAVKKIKALSDAVKKSLYFINDTYAHLQHTQNNKAQNELRLVVNRFIQMHQQKVGKSGLALFQGPPLPLRAGNGVQRLRFDTSLDDDISIPPSFLIPAILSLFILLRLCGSGDLSTALIVVLVGVGLNHYLKGSGLPEANHVNRHENAKKTNKKEGGRQEDLKEGSQERNKQHLTKWKLILEKDPDDIVALRKVCIYSGYLNSADKDLGVLMPKYFARSDKDVKIWSFEYVAIRWLSIKYFESANKLWQAGQSCREILYYDHGEEVKHYQKAKRLAEITLGKIQDEANEDRNDNVIRF